MKGLVLKDLYNIRHNYKSMLLILCIFAVIFAEGQGASFLIVCMFLCSMMTITTFNFDETSGWMEYALILPVKRKDIVNSKFLVLGIFTAVGLGIGLLVAIAERMFFYHVEFTSESFLELFIISAVSLGLVLMFGSVMICLIFRFGAEKARILRFAVFLIPFGLGLLLREVLKSYPVSFNEPTLITVVSVGVPILILLIVYGMYVLSCRILERQEF